MKIPRINCQFYQEGRCSCKNIKRSLWGLGSRSCILLYASLRSDCDYRLPWLPPPKPPKGQQPLSLAPLIFAVSIGQKFEPAPVFDDVIVGHWAEDLSPYYITVPPQLRPVFLHLLNNLQTLSTTLTQEDLTTFRTTVRKLWDNSVNSPEYDKKLWIELEQFLLQKFNVQI